MPIKEVLDRIIADASPDELKELADLVRSGVLRGAEPQDFPNIIEDKDRFAEAFCVGVSGDALHWFDKQYPKECYWYLRVRSDSLVEHSFLLDCQSDFADFTVLGTKGKTIKFFSQLEEHAVEDRPLMRILDTQAKIVMLPPTEFCNKEQPVWEFTCKMQGYPDNGGMELFLGELRDSQGYPFIQVIAPDGKTIVAFYGVKEEWDNIFCLLADTPKYSQEYLHLLDSDADMGLAMETWEDKLYWADGWDARRLRGLIRRPRQSLFDGTL